MKEQFNRQSQVSQALFSIRKVEQLQQYLTGNPKISIIKINDSQGNNVLHQLAFEGYLDLIKIYIHEAKKIIIKQRGQRIEEGRHNDKQLDDWINQRNNQGFTPLLYASYSGHLEVIRYLYDQNKANIFIKTNTGLNCLHLAAQKNMIMPFLYFRDKISLDEIDDLGSTPLHWAAYMNNQEVVSYILSNNILKSLNTTDFEGNTALMLAVTYGNTRIVRRLLIRGANRKIKNNQSKLPIQVARESEFKTISKMLSQDYSMCDLIKFYCNIKIEYKPKQRKFTIPSIFMLGFVMNVAIINIFIKFTENFAFYSEIVIFGMMILLYLSLLLVKPQNQQRPFEQLLSQFNEKSIKKVCFQCRNITPKRGYHCDTCGVCIRQYDHHCTWINNCVGKNNIGKFMFFVVFLVLSLGLLGLLSILSTISILFDDPHKFAEWFGFRYQYQNDLEKFSLLAMFFINEVTSIFFFPVFTLLFVQIKNLLTNKTTFENNRGPVTQQGNIKKRLKNNKKVSLRNCKVMCTDYRGSFSTNRSSFHELLTDKYPSQSLEALRS